MNKLSNRQANFLQFLSRGSLYVSQKNLDYRSAEALANRQLATIVERNKYGNTYTITPAGLAYLYQDAPMVDQPQPAPESEGFKVGDFVDYVDINNRMQRGQIFNISPYGKLYIVSSTGNRHIERMSSNVRRVSE